MDTINMDTAKRIAFADTSHLGRPRWSELAVYFLPEMPEGKAWLAVSTGMSSRAGEVPLVDKLHTYSLDRALELFDDSQVGSIVKAQARDWAEAQVSETMRFASEGNPQTSANAFTGTTDSEAIGWLFGDGVSMRRVAEALGLGESTLRMGLNKGHAVKVPLLSVISYLDRERFRADTLGGETDG